MLLALATVLVTSELRILFLGNSHTALNDIPGQVKSILELNSQRKVLIGSVSGANLESLSSQKNALDAIQSGEWDVVVLQGAALSSSHKYVYSQAGAINLARIAKRAKARVVLFAEWPRKGWNETQYILEIYRQIAKASGAEIVPVCSAWDKALKMQKSLDLWSSDGNHSSPMGGYLASVTIADFLGAGPYYWQPKGIDEDTAKILRAAARSVIPTPSKE